MNPQEHFEAGAANKHIADTIAAMDKQQLLIGKIVKSYSAQIVLEKRSSFTNGMLVAAFVICGVIGGFEILGVLYFFGGCK